VPFVIWQITVRTRVYVNIDKTSRPNTTKLFENKDVINESNDNVYDTDEENRLAWTFRRVRLKYVVKMLSSNPSNVLINTNENYRFISSTRNSNVRVEQLIRKLTFYLSKTVSFALKTNRIYLRRNYIRSAARGPKHASLLIFFVRMYIRYMYVRKCVRRFFRFILL